MQKDEVCGVYSTQKKTRKELGILGAKFQEMSLLLSRICRLTDNV
jgi:hypothetical protein